MNGKEFINSLGLTAIDIPVVRGVYLMISEHSDPCPEEGLTELSGLPDGWRAKLTPAGSRSPIRYTANASEYGLHPLSLFEMRRYVWRLHSDQEGIDLRSYRISSSIKNTSKADWIEYRLKKESPRGEFRVCNYLGTAALSVTGMPAPVKFDIVTEKMGFADEYRSMVEMIAGCCQQLLLDWGSPTSLNFSSDPEKKSRILLEQFLFLRSILGNDKLAFYLEILQRNPHNMLCEETNWYPLGVSSARGFLRNPVDGGKNWMTSDNCFLMGCSGLIPSEILDSRKFESMDTPPNRFVKFALESFRAVCHEVSSLFIQKDPSAAAVIEAESMMNTLDSFLSSPLFTDVGPMRRVPHESQALQKRDGYRQILQAWLMLDAAAQLDWLGREDAYDGTTRNVALLYEYWLYFIIYQLLKHELKLEEIKIDPIEKMGILPFVEPDPRGLRISLKQGKTSISAFRRTYDDGSKLRIHLYYNRSFYPSGENNELLACGSYTRIFRPDYTLVIFPEGYAQTGKDPLKSESFAEQEGHIAYLHFDAKFRVEFLSQLFGKEHKTLFDEKNDIQTEILKDLDMEHQEITTTDMYKRGDLYKMHTYNDAIRRTVGSYVLYPGKDKSDTRFSRYHEILPGVGAFAIRPDFVNGETTAIGTSALTKFIEDVLVIQKNIFSQLHRVNYWTHETIKEPPGIYNADVIVPDGEYPPADTEVLLGWVRDKEIGQMGKENRLFYFHAVEEAGNVSKLDPQIFKAKYIIPYIEKHCLGWYASIKDCCLIPNKDLIKKIGGSHNCKYYYLLTLGEPVEIPAIDLAHIIMSPRDRRPKLIKWDKLFKT